MRRRNKVLLITLAVILVIIAGFVIWAQTPPAPMPETAQALRSDSSVEVSTGKWLTFSPHGKSTTTGLIIYPGGRVHFQSYAPVARAIASEGYCVVIVPMPLNLAVIGINKADSVIKAYPEIKTWAIGGHSLGGTMAAQFAHDNPSIIRGLILWTAYPTAGNDFSQMGTKVATIHGTRDGLVSKADIDNSMKLLPVEAIRLEIEGGNHAQFGWYGNQPGDGEATISRERQQEQVVGATIQLLKEISEQ